MTDERDEVEPTAVADQGARAVPAPPEDAPMIVVCVVLYNSVRLLADFVDALPAGLQGLRWRLVAADNASTDGSAEALLRLAPHGDVVDVGSNRGYAAGVNAGAGAAGEFDALLVVNPDVRLRPGCVATLHEALATPGVGIAVPRLVDGAGKLLTTMRRKPTLLRAMADAMIGATRAGRLHPLLGEVVMDERQYERRQLADWAEGSTQLISAECWKECGPWDETFFLYSEETEYDLRARAEGFATIFVPEANAVHLTGGSATSPQLWALLSVNRLRLYRRGHGRMATVLFWLALVLREASRALLGSRPSRAALRALCNPQRLWESPGPASIGVG